MFVAKTIGMRPMSINSKPNQTFREHNGKHDNRGDGKVLSLKRQCAIVREFNINLHNNCISFQMQPPLENESSVLVFTLSGLNVTMENRFVFFSFTALFYPLMVFCNLTVIFTIILHKKFHEPMYVFLCNLCVNGLFGTSGFYPKFMYDLLAHDHVISYTGCLIQIFVIYSSALSDFSTLTVMAYDRYLAICRPLEYHSIMTNQRVLEWILFCC